MSSESNRVAAQLVDAGNLDGVVKLTTKDTGWAANILEQEFYSDPLLNFIYGDKIDEPGKLNWFLRARSALQHCTDIVFQQSRRTAC